MGILAGLVILALLVPGVASAAWVEQRPVEAAVPSFRSVVAQLKDTADKAERKIGEVFRDTLADGRECGDECPELVVLPIGSFVMGSPPSEPGRFENEGPQHKVTITEPMAVGRYEVTFAEWEACVSDHSCRDHLPDDEGWGRGRRPVINVSWEDALSYIAWLKERTGKDYRLLSEAEWEYAARSIADGRVGTRYYWGDGIQPGLANCLGCGGLGADVPTLPVGSHDPNAFGLYDMLGNVWEWVMDPSHDSFVEAPDDGRVWAEGGDQSRRVIRGGAWSSTQRGIRVANRNFATPDKRADFIGFRVARPLE